MPEFIFYSAVAGAAIYGGLWFWLKDHGIPWIATIIIAVIVVLFIFPDPTKAKDLSDLFGNVALVLFKGIWLLAWGGGAFGVYYFTKDANRF